MILTTLLLLSTVQTTEPAIVGGELRHLGAASELSRDMTGVDGPAWVGYAVPAIDGAHNTCGGVLDLDGGGGSLSNATDDETIGELYVLARVVSGELTRLRAVSSGCKIRARGEPVYWLSSVSIEDSLGFLGDIVQRRADSDIAASAVHAIAWHAGAAADERLAELARGDAPDELRQKAVFWMGSARGERGYTNLRALLDTATERELREKIVFALHVSDAREATSTLIAVARDDADAQVREKALFWLAQEAGAEASAAIAGAVRDDPELEVKKKAVFALSQLPPDEGIPLLVSVAETHPQPEIRKKAFFWLGQSGDPRALALIARVLGNGR